MEKYSVYEIRNPKWAGPGIIDVEIEHPDFGWVPYTAIEGDESTLAVYMDAVQFLPEYDGPDLPTEAEIARTSASIPKADFLFACAGILKLMSKAEALEAAKSDEIPAALRPALMQLPEEVRFMEELRWLQEPEVSRNSPLVTQLGRSRFGAKADFVLDEAFGIGGGNA